MKVLVLGCGSIGRRHIRNIINNFEHDLFAFDPVLDNLKIVKKEFGVKTFDNEEDAFNIHPDIVIVAGPTATHVQCARKAIDTGAHVFIEKPISHSMDGVETLIKTAGKLKRFIGIGSNMRFHPGPNILKSNLSKLGKIYYSSAEAGYFLPYMRLGIDYRTVYASKKAMGGGVILDAIHEIDYHLWFFGNVSDLFCRAAKLGNLEIDVEDYAELSLNFSSGVKTQIRLDFLQKYLSRGCKIVGENGILIWETKGKNPSKCSVKFYNAKDKKWKVLFNQNDFDIDECYIAQFKEFFEIIKGGEKRTMADGQEGLHALTIAWKAKESAKQKKIITF